MKTVAALLLAAIGTMGALVGQSAPQAPDRSAPPKPGPVAALTLPPDPETHAVERRAGVDGGAAQGAGGPRFARLKGGSAADPPGKYGVASLTAEMLDEGAGQRNALQIADAVDYLGASLSTSSTSDATYVDLHVPVARLGDALPIMADVALRPTFPQEELQRVREESLDLDLRGPGRSGVAHPVRLSAPGLRSAAPLRHDVDRHGGLGERLQRRGSAAISRATLRAVERRAHRDRRRSRHLTVARLEAAFGAGRATAAANRPRSRRATADDAGRLLDRQAGRGAVADPDRLGRRAAIDARLLRAARPQHDPRRLVYVPAQSEPARGARLRVRRELDVRHARRAAGPFYAAAGVQTDKTVGSLTEFFKELDAHSQADPCGGTREGEKLPRAAAAAKLRDHGKPRRLARANVHLQPACRLLRDLHRTACAR